MSELISVIVPVFRTERYIERCLKSILAQTYKDIEIIVVDDGTDDKAGEIADKFSETEPKIKVIHKQNGIYVSTVRRTLSTRGLPLFHTC